MPLIVADADPSIRNDINQTTMSEPNGERVKLIIPSGGSLGSWVDEDGSQLPYLMRIADSLSIDMLNAYCSFKTPS